MLSATARAAYPQFAGSVDSFRMTLVAPNDASSCVFWPEGQSDPVACAGLDVAAVGKAVGGLAPSADATLVGAALVRRSAQEVPPLFVMVTFTKEEGEIDLAYIEGFAGGALKAVRQRVGATGSTHGGGVLVKRHGGVDVAEFQIVGEFPPGDPVAAMFSQGAYYVVPATGGLYTVVFTGGAGSWAKMEEVSDASIATIHIDRPRSIARTDATAKRLHAWGDLISYAAVLLGLVALGVRTALRTSRQRKAAHGTPAYGGYTRERAQGLAAGRAPEWFPELRWLVTAMGEVETDAVWAEELLCSLKYHPDPLIRSAMLGSLAALARRFQRIHCPGLVADCLTRVAVDADPEVAARAQAITAELQPAFAAGAATTKKPRSATRPWLVALAAGVAGLVSSGAGLIAYLSHRDVGNGGAQGAAAFEVAKGVGLATAIIAYFVADWWRRR